MKYRFIKKSKYTLIASITSKNKSKHISSFRADIVEYALQFEGNPYVWGGTSLTKGADCSGFTQSVFKSKGILLPRTARNQAEGGRSVPLSNLQPGDLIFYRKDNQINHVALYIGKKKVIHASNPKSGIKISKYNYRKPYKVVSYFD